MTLLQHVVAGVAAAAALPGVLAQFAENGVGPNEEAYSKLSKGGKYLTYMTYPPQGTSGTLTSVSAPGVFNNYTIDLTFTNDALMVPPTYNGTWQRPCDDPCPYPTLFNATQADVDAWYYSWYQNSTVMHPLNPNNRTLDAYHAMWTHINNVTTIGVTCNGTDHFGDGVGENQQFCQFTFAEPKLFCLQAAEPKMRESDGVVRTMVGHEMEKHHKAYTVCNLRNVTLVGPGRLRLYFYDTMATMPNYNAVPGIGNQTVFDAYFNGISKQNYNVDLVDDPAYWRTKADLSDQTAVILLSGTDNRVPESNGVDGVIGMRHHAGQILAPRKQDFYRGFSQWTHVAHTWFRMNNRTPNMTQPCYSSKRRNLTDYNEEAQYDPISLRPAFDRVFYYDNEVPRVQNQMSPREIFDWIPAGVTQTANSSSVLGGPPAWTHFNYDSANRILRWDAELNDTGIITFNHSLDMWSLPAYAMKIDNSSQWQWKYYWHPLRAWTLTLHDPIAAYPLKKVDRIYSAYHRTIANILPDVELHTFQNMQDAFMDYIPYQNVKERLYTEELESQENVQKYFTMGFYNRTGLLTYIPNANFDSTKFEASWTNVTMQMEMLDYAVWQGPRGTGWAKGLTRDLPVSYGFRLVWDKTSEHSRGAGAWYRQYGFFKRGSQTWGDPTGSNNKQVMTCSRWSPTTASDPIGLSSLAYYIHYDRSRAWDVYVVDKQYPQINASNILQITGGYTGNMVTPGKAMYTETTPGGYQRQVRTGMTFETHWHWWMYGPNHCTNNCEQLAAGNISALAYDTTFNSSAGPVLSNTTDWFSDVVSKSQFGLHRGYQKWHLTEDNRGKWYRAGWDIAGWGNRSSYKAGISFKVDWTILSNEWYYPPFEADIPNYKILSQVDGLTGRMQPNYTYPLYFIPNYMYHNGCYGVQAYRDVDQQGPDRAYFGVFNCTMQEGECYKNTPYNLRHQPEFMAPFGYVNYNMSMRENWAIDGYQASGAGHLPVGQPFFQYRRWRAQVRPGTYNKTLLAREGYLQGKEQPFRQRPYHPNIGPGLKELYTIARPVGVPVTQNTLRYLDNTTLIDRMYAEGLDARSIQPEWEDYIHYYPYEDTAADGNDLLQLLRNSETTLWNRNWPPSAINGQSPYTRGFRNTKLASWALPYKMAGEYANPTLAQAGNVTAPDGRSRYMEAWKYAYYFKPQFHTDNAGNIRYNWAFVPDSDLSVFSNNQTEVNMFYQSMSNVTHYPDFFFYSSANFAPTSDNRGNQWTNANPVTPSASVPFLMLEQKVKIKWYVSILFHNTTLKDRYGEGNRPLPTLEAPYYQ